MTLFNDFRVATRCILGRFDHVATMQSADNQRNEIFVTAIVERKKSKKYLEEQKKSCYLCISGSKEMQSQQKAT